MPKKKQATKKGQGAPSPDLPAENNQARVVSAINKIFLSALSRDNVEELAQYSLDVLQELIGSAYGFIGEVNPVGRFDTIAISNPGWEACTMEKSSATLLITDMRISGLWGKVIQDGAPFFTNAPAEHPASTGLPKDHPPMHSFLGIPIRHNNSISGMIALANKEGGFNEEDLRTGESLSLAIDQALRSKRNELQLVRQSQEILEVSTPLLQMWDGILVAPLIGTMDSHRTRLFMDKFLDTIVRTNAAVALMDITGVPAMDTQTAKHIIDAINAAGLLGAEVLLTGVRAETAQTLVHLGIDLSEVTTRASLASGIQVALKKQGLAIIPFSEVQE